MKVDKSTFVNKNARNDLIAMVEESSILMDFDGVLIHQDILLCRRFENSSAPTALLVSEILNFDSKTGLYINNFKFNTLSERILLYASIFVARTRNPGISFLCERNAIINYIIGFFLSLWLVALIGYKKFRCKVGIISHHLRLANATVESINKFDIIATTLPQITASIEMLLPSHNRIITLYHRASSPFELSGTNLLQICHYGQMTDYRISRVAKLAAALGGANRTISIDYVLTTKHTPNVSAIVLKQDASMSFLSITKVISYVNSGKIPILIDEFEYHPVSTLCYTLNEYLNLIDNSNYDFHEIKNKLEYEMNVRIARYNDFIKDQSFIKFNGRI